LQEKIKHLEFIQQAITRMASNSFFLKGWTVTLIVGVLAFTQVKNMDSKYITIALIPTLAFWCLDGFFLRQEKLFRALYDEVRVKRLGDIDFLMNTSFLANRIDSWIKVCFSKTLGLFYLPIIIVIMLAVCGFNLENLFGQIKGFFCVSG
jgi:hypothetical protein